MSDIRHSLQNLADALSPDTGTSDGFVDNVETSLARISQALPKKLGGKIEAESLADEYDDQATYGIGDYCTHDGVFYICATAIAIAESWNSAKWVAVPIIEILQEKLNAPADGAVAGRYLMVGQNGEPVWDQLDESGIRQSVYDWLSAHPEAIVVNDGTITRAKLDDSVGQAVDEVSELKADLSQLAKKRYMLDNPVKALFPEFTSKFWCSNVLPSVLTGKQLVLTISGTEGDDHITPTAITPSDINISAITTETGVVLTTDSIEYEVYNIKYDSATESLSIYPPLKQTVEDATLAQAYLDAGENYTAMHLTEHGYRAYVWFLYNQNPKHCEVGLYNASFNAMYDATFPFNKLSNSSGTPLYLGPGTRNTFLYYLRNFYTRYFSASWSVGYTPYEQKNGIYWDVNLNETSGYLELLMSAWINTDFIDLPEGEELYVDVYIDGELAHREVITNAVGRRICVDYKNALTGRLEIYSNKWDAISGGGKAIHISKAVWWINELDYAEDQKLFPTGSVVAMEFDSWGVFHDGVTGTALHDLINADAGCTVDFTNHSLGNQTTAWGMAYWYQNIKAYNPAIAITDFLINDTNSVSYAPDVIVGPDGKEYPNKITQDMYLSNIKKLIAYAVNNRIQPIVMRNTQITYNDFPEFAINGISEQYTP